MVPGLVQQRNLIQYRFRQLRVPFDSRGVRPTPGVEGRVRVRGGPIDHFDHHALLGFAVGGQIDGREGAGSELLGQNEVIAGDAAGLGDVLGAEAPLALRGREGRGEGNSGAGRGGGEGGHDDRARA